MIRQVPGQDDHLTPQASLTLSPLREAVGAVAPGRLSEMFAKMQEAFVQAGELGSVTRSTCFTVSGPSSWRSRGTLRPPGACTRPSRL